MKNISFYSLDYNVEFLEVTLRLCIRTEQCAATKDVVHYSTTNEDEAIAWAEKMYDNGYKVSI